MFDKRTWLPPNSRQLTEEEAKKATDAILWLIKKKNLKPKHICSLQTKNLDRESKTLYVCVETRHVVLYRKIRYQRSPLEEWLEILPSLKNRLFIFPAYAHAGREPAYGSSVRVGDVENYLKNQRRKGLILLKQYDKIEISTTKSHIPKQIMVGRRIALRA